MPASYGIFLKPSVATNADLFGNNLQAKDNLVSLASLRMIPVFEKMSHDSKYRLEYTLRILRACRLFNFHFIAETEIEALLQE